MASVRALEEELRTRAAERRATQSELARLEEKLKRRRQLLDEGAAKTADRARLDAEKLEAEPALDLARRRRQEADDAEATCRRALESVEAERSTLERQAERRRLEHELASLERTAEAIRAAKLAASEQSARAEGEAVTPPIRSRARAPGDRHRRGQSRPARRRHPVGAATRYGGQARQPSRSSDRSSNTARADRAGDV